MDVMRTLKCDIGVKLVEAGMSLSEKAYTIGYPE